jgi:putative ABC transport system permease protein
MKDFFLLAFSNLRRRKLRSWLTMIGIFIGIAAVVGLISLGQGLQSAINQQFQQLGTDKIIIQTKVLGPPGSGSGKLVLTDKDLDAIRQVRGVDSAEGVLLKTAIVTFRGQTQIVYVLGLTQGYLDLFKGTDAVAVVEGRQLKAGDNFKIVVGNNHVFGNLWSKPAEVGNSMNVNGQDFKIVGVQKKQGNPIDDTEVIMPKDVLAKLFNTGNEEAEIIVKTKAGFNPDDVANDISRKLRQERNEKVGEETFTVQTAEQLLSSFSTIFAIVQGVLVGIAAISLIVGGIGIMNTMYTAVLERTKEIGTMKAVGAKNSDILMIFLFESGLLGVIGGAIGIAIGFGLGKGAQFIATAALGTSLLQAVFPWYLIVGALLFSFIVGSASGALPAIQASRLKPADALRYE